MKYWLFKKRNPYNVFLTNGCGLVWGFFFLFFGGIFFFGLWALCLRSFQLTWCGWVVFFVVVWWCFCGGVFVVVFVWWCFCGGVVCGGVVVLLCFLWVVFLWWCGWVVFLWWCLCGVVVFSWWWWWCFLSLLVVFLSLWWCFLFWCFCDGVVVLLCFLWWCFCGGLVVFLCFCGGVLVVF